MHVNTLTQLIWTAPAWGFALIALALPVTAHLWSRRAGAPAIFPSIRLLKDTYARQARRSRWREIWLMMLRCAVVMCIVAAFTQPTWLSGQLDSPTQRADAPLSIVLDASASMQRPHRGVPLFDRAKQRAVKLVEQHIGTRPVEVIIAEAVPSKLLPQPSTNRAALIEHLQRAACTNTFADLASAVDTATSDEVHVLTDGQTTAWSRELAAIDKSLNLITLGTPTDNLAIERPRLNPASPRVGEKVALVYDLVSYHTQATTAQVTVQHDGLNHIRTHEIKPSQRITSSLTIRFRRVGFHTIRIALPTDGFASDNAITLPIHVRPTMRWHLLGAKNVDSPNHASFYLKRALPAEASSQDDAEVFVVCDPSHLNRAQVSKLMGRVASGATLLWFASADVDDLLPLQLGEMSPFVSLRSETPDRAMSLTLREADQPPWAVFEGDAASTLQTVAFTRRVVGDLTPDAVRLADWSDGRCAVAMRPHGQGCVILFSGDIQPTSTTFTRSPAFLPFIREVIKFGQPVPPALPLLHPADQAAVPLPGDRHPEGYRIIGPDGASLPFEIHTQPEQVNFIVPGVRELGLYRIMHTDQAVTGFGAMLDPRESDLRNRIDSPDAASAQTSVTTSSGQKPKGTSQPLWPWCLLAAMVLLVVEAASGRWQEERA